MPKVLLPPLQDKYDIYLSLRFHSPGKQSPIKFAYRLPEVAYKSYWSCPSASIYFPTCIYHRIDVSGSSGSIARWSCRPRNIEISNRVQTENERPMYWPVFFHPTPVLNWGWQLLAQNPENHESLNLLYGSGDWRWLFSCAWIRSHKGISSWSGRC